MITRLPESPFRVSRPSVSGSELDAKTLLDFLSELSRSWTLRPEYDERSVNWLLEVLAQKSEHGTFQGVAVRDSAGEPVGWYLYYRNRGGIGEVVQVGAREEWTGQVLDHLFYHAWRAGVLALSGRIEPRFLPEFRDRRCVFLHRGYWMLVHSRRPETLEPIHRGEALLTRLEGEWSMQFPIDGHRPAPARAATDRDAGSEAAVSRDMSRIS